MVVIGSVRMRNRVKGDSRECYVRIVQQEKRHSGKRLLPGRERVGEPDWNQNGHWENDFFGIGGGTCDNLQGRELLIEDANVHIYGHLKTDGSRIGANNGTSMGTTFDICKNNCFISLKLHIGHFTIKTATKKYLYWIQ